MRISDWSSDVCSSVLLDLTLPRRVSRLRSTRTAIGGFALMLPLASLWRIARRDLAARIRGLRLLAVCLFLGVATLAAIGSLTRGITSELEVRGQTNLGGDVEFSLPQREAPAEQMAGFGRVGPTAAPVPLRALATGPHGGARTPDTNN